MSPWRVRGEIPCIVFNRLIGLPAFVPLESFEFKVIFTYIPIAIGMVIEPILVSIGTCQSMMAPYTALEPGPAFSPNSLALDYDRSPPHFLLFSSLRSGNLPLAALAFTILYSNVLAVALAGLFIPSSRQWNSTIAVHSFSWPKFQGSFTDPAQEMYYRLFGSLTSGKAARAAPNWTTSEYYVLPIAHTSSDRIREFQVSTHGIGIAVGCTVVPAILTCGDRIGGINRSSVCPNRERTNMRYFVTVNDTCWGYQGNNPSMPTIELEWKLISYDDIYPSPTCHDTFYAMWLEKPANPAPPTRDLEDLYLNSLDGIVIRCNTTEKVVKLTADVDPKYQVLSTRVDSELSPPEVRDLYLGRTTTNLSSAFLNVLQSGLRLQDSSGVHFINWISHLVTMIDPMVARTLTNITHVPNPDRIVKAFAETYRHLFAINMQLYEDKIIVPAEPLPETILAPVVVVLDRVNMSVAMYSILVSGLLMTIAMLVVIYWGLKHPDGQRPESLAGMYALLYASNAREECGQLSGANPVERAKRLKALGGKYVYGRFPDGTHHGVYRSEELKIDKDK